MKPGGGSMLLEYIQTALESAKYEIIDDKEPYYGEIPALAGVWATGESLLADGHIRMGSA